MSRDGLIFVCLFQIYFRILSKLTQLTGSALFDEGAHSNLDHEGAQRTRILRLQLPLITTTSR